MGRHHGYWPSCVPIAWISPTSTSTVDVRVIAATNKDLPVLQYSVIVIATIYMASTLLADVLIAWLNPRARLDLDSA